MGVTFTDEQLGGMVDFIKNYCTSINAATGSGIDANANVNNKNIATLEPEISKSLKAQINRYWMYNQIKEDWGKEQADKYIDYLNNHLIYKHDETHIAPYCAALNSQNFLLYGTTQLGGESKAPCHLDSYCGAFVNYVYACSSQFAGAIANPDFLLHFDFFARLDYGDNYLDDYRTEIENHLQTVIYGINHPAGNRGYQSVFWNVAVFDKYYFEGLFGGEINPENGQRVGQFKFPAMFEDMEKALYRRVLRNSKTCLDKLDSKDRRKYSKLVSKEGVDALPEEIKELIKDEIKDIMNRYEELRTPKYESVHKLQKFFTRWLHYERLRKKSLLTFPVLTLSYLTDDHKALDREYVEWAAEELADGNTFFNYEDSNVASLSSCCRLRNGIDKKEFSFSTGAGGLATGSISVITINFNRLIQQHYSLEAIVRDVQKFQISYRHIMEYFLANKMLPVYDAGFIHMSKQYLTVGINGMVEAAEYLGYEISNNKEYKDWIASQLKIISDLNKEMTAQYHYRFNTEFVPAEGLGVKNAKWDREDGLVVPRDVYNSYFFKVEDDSMSVLDKMELHGRQTVQYLDGGSACHINLQEHASKEAYIKLIDWAAEVGCNYWTINVMGTLCKTCGYKSDKTLHKCPKCGGDDLSYITRVIGYHKEISSFEYKRQLEANRRYYGKVEC